MQLTYASIDYWTDVTQKVSGVTRLLKEEEERSRRWTVDDDEEDATLCSGRPRPTAVRRRASRVQGGRETVARSVRRAGDWCLVFGPI